MKKILSIVLTLAVLLSFSTAVSADSGITINAVNFEEYVDEYGSVDEALLTVKVSFTLSQTTDQLSLLLTSENITEISEETKAKIIYMDQGVTPEEGIYEFTVEKEKIKSATGLDDIEGCTLYIKMGGKNAADMATETIVYATPTSDILYGDLNNDLEIDYADAVLLLRYNAGLISLTEAQLEAAYLTDDSEADFADAIVILKYNAGLIDKVK